MKECISVMNCNGCKWLDRYKTDGSGYCCMVQRSKTYKESYVSENGLLICSSKVRNPDMERCELYEFGDFATRYKVNKS